MVDDFYKAFEDRYRGSRELIAGRLAAYLPFILPLRSLGGERSAIDLGCGRGEWLELLLEHGFSPRGVDIDEGMLADCTARGLPAERGDALRCLQTLANDSQLLVSAFHFVEHIDFADVAAVVREALRVLRPGGLLILETPNPENLLVGTHEFYLDPSHQRPIPPNLLRFLVEHGGFGRTRVLRLNPRQEPAAGAPATVLAMLEGVGLDYAVVAQKPAADERGLALLDDAFRRESGPDLQALAGRFDARVCGIDQRLERLSAETERLHQELQQTRADAAYWHEKTDALLLSFSWRVTAPLRLGLDLSKKLLARLAAAGRRALGVPLRLVLRKPVLAARVNATLLRRTPRLHALLRDSAVSTGLVHDSPLSAYGSQRRNPQSGRSPLLPPRGDAQQPVPTGVLIERIYQRLGRNGGNC
jgi:SAM-dependent methyltransferase